MTSKVVADALETFLRAEWTICPIYTENVETETPEDGSAFLLLQFPVANTERPILDPHALYWETGGFRIVIHVEAGGGMTKMRQWGALLIDLFRDVTVSPGVQCLVAEEPFVQGSPDGNYLVGAMVVPYRFAHEAS